MPPYSDLTPFSISAYSKLEIIAEKMRALLQQQEKWPRPRDLYDLLQRSFSIKCRSKRIEDDPEALTSEKLREWNRNAWNNQLEQMMREVPDYDMVWDDWTKKCRGIFGTDLPHPS